MPSPTPVSPTPGPATPVFVDDSGRRRARLLVAVRIVVGVLALYVALAVISLVAPVTFPIAHLGHLGVLPRHRQNATLGPQSKEAALPPALAGSGATPPAKVETPTATTIATGQTSTPGTSPSGAIVPPPQSSTPTAATTIPTGRTTTPTTAPTVGTTTTTVPASTTTSRQHGPPTTGTHGPPSTTPGKGSKP